MLRLIALFAPAIVCFAWAVLAFTHIESVSTTALGRASLGLALLMHVREEIRARA